MNEHEKELMNRWLGLFPEPDIISDHLEDSSYSIEAMEKERNRCYAIGFAQTTKVYQPMSSAPKDGTPILVLLNNSSVPHAVYWSPSPIESKPYLSTWRSLWDNSRINISDMRCWMHCPEDPESKG